MRAHIFAVDTFVSKLRYAIGREEQPGIDHHASTHSFVTVIRIATDVASLVTFLCRVGSRAAKSDEESRSRKKEIGTHFAMY